VPDFRLSVLPDEYAALVETEGMEQRFRDAVPRVREMAEELASYGVTETLQHDDLHDGNVFVRDGRHLILDWGDAVVSHPFFTLSVTLEGFLSWGLDDIEGSVDIRPVAERYVRRYDPDRPELLDAVPLAMRLGWACRAANASVVEDAASTRNRLLMLVDGRV
jgi:aminoglycoside phosphotransferase (APT) family kinase protein